MDEVQIIAELLTYVAHDPECAAEKPGKPCDCGLREIETLAAEIVDEG